jgi:hypothetical protein
MAVAMPAPCTVFVKKQEQNSRIKAKILGTGMALAVLLAVSAKRYTHHSFRHGCHFLPAVSNSKCQFMPHLLVMTFSYAVLQVSLTSWQSRDTPSPEELLAIGEDSYQMNLKRRAKFLALALVGCILVT